MTIYGANAQADALTVKATPRLAGEVCAGGQRITTTRKPRPGISTGRSTLPAPGSATADSSPGTLGGGRGFYNWSSDTSSPGRADGLTEHRQLFDPGGTEPVYYYEHTYEQLSRGF